MKTPPARIPKTHEPGTPSYTLHIEQPYYPKTPKLERATRPAKPKEYIQKVRVVNARGRAVTGKG